MDDIEIIEDVKPIKKKNKKIMIIIVLIIICLLTGVGFFFLTQNSKSENVEDKEETTIEISQETKNELLKIIDLTEEGHELLSSDEIKTLGLDSQDYMNLSLNDLLATYLSFSADKDIIINELDDDLKKEIVFKYANKNKMTTVDNCSFYLDKDLLDKIKLLYGIENIKFEDSKIINEKYNYNLSCSKSKNIVKIVDSLSFERENNSINILYKVKLNDDISKTIKFTFNQKDDDSYYLYKVNVKND